jgi:RNA polymerase sigma-70 factor, ECF subfamily
MVRPLGVGPIVPAATVSAVQAPSEARALDDESQAWLDDLRSDGAIRDEAVARLHALLLRGARFELNRRRAQLAALRLHDLDDLATQCADDACVAVLGKLDDFRGDSRFTTWAYKFAILHAASHVRRLAWRGRELPLEPQTWERFEGARGPDADAEQAELLGAIRGAIDDALTPHQRRVLLALAVDGVPIDVLAERLSTTRNALYKTLHDARRKLRENLAEKGLA